MFISYSVSNRLTIVKIEGDEDITFLKNIVSLVL